MSRENRPYSPYSGRSPRAESWRPDRTYGDYGRERRYGYDSGYGSTYESPYSSTYGGSDPRTQVLDADDRRGYDRYGSDRYAPQDHDSDDVAPEYDDDEIYEYYEPLDRRWVWVGGVAGAILLVAVICTVVILGGGDSGSVSATVVPPTATSQAPATTSKAPPAASTPRVLPPVASLPPETVTTVSPSPSATVAPPPVAAAPPPAPAANTVTYSVTGTRPLIDLVTVIYTDAQGALKTDLNASLPWNKTVVLDPGVTLSSVTATSVTGQLNCSIVDGAGATIAVQNSNSMITTCTR